MVNIVKFGGGTNSTAMLLGMYQRNIHVDVILFCDTGGERPDTYEFRDLFSKWLVAHGMPSITTIEYFTKEGKHLTLEQQCLQTHSLPSIAYGGKSCSQKYKIRTANRFCNGNVDCQKAWTAGERVNNFIGYDAGESRRVEHAAALDEREKKYNNIYLLYEWGWTRADCISAIQAAGLPQPGKSSCFFCPSMKKKEIQELWERYPDLFKRAIEIEQNAKETLTTIKGLGRHWAWGDYQKEYFDALNDQKAQLSLFDFIDSPGGCLCGTPCGCYDG